MLSHYSISKPEKQREKNSKQLAKVLEKNTVHVHCTNTYKEWVALQNKRIKCKFV